MWSACTASRNLIANDMWAMGNVLMYMLTLQPALHSPCIRAARWAKQHCRHPRSMGLLIKEAAKLGKLANLTRHQVVLWSTYCVPRQLPSDLTDPDSPTQGPLANMCFPSPCLAITVAASGLRVLQRSKGWEAVKQGKGPPAQLDALRAFGDRECKVATALLCQLLHPDRADRPTAHQALQSGFL